MANRNFASGGKMYSMHIKPVKVDCKFIVNSSDSAGLGITSLKGPMVQNVFMHTSATPGKGNANPASPNVSVTNPNPASGLIVVQLQDNYNQVFNVLDATTVALSGSDVKIDNNAMTAGQVYTISTLGNASAAKWAAIGVPAGVTPAVGVSFIAASNGGSGNTLTSRVQAPASTGSGILKIEAMQGASLTCAPNPAANQGFGAQIILQCYSANGTVAAPADGSTIHLELYLSDSSIQIAGE